MATLGRSATAAGYWVKVESKSNPGSFYEYHSVTRVTRWVANVQALGARAAPVEEKKHDASKSALPPIVVVPPLVGSSDLVATFEREAFRSRQLMAIYERGIANRDVVPLLMQRKPNGMPEGQLVNAHLWQHLALQKQQGVEPDLLMRDVAASVQHAGEMARAVEAARNEREAIKAAAAAAPPLPKAAIATAADEARIAAEVEQQERRQLLLECDAIVKRLSSDGSMDAAASAVKRRSSDGTDAAALPPAKRARTASSAASDIALALPAGRVAAPAAASAAPSASNVVPAPACALPAVASTARPVASDSSVASSVRSPSIMIRTQAEHAPLPVRAQSSDGSVAPAADGRVAAAVEQAPLGEFLVCHHTPTYQCSLT